MTSIYLLQLTEEEFLRPTRHDFPVLCIRAWSKQAARAEAARFTGDAMWRDESVTECKRVRESGEESVIFYAAGEDPFFAGR